MAASFNLPEDARACLPLELNAMQRACEPIALQQDVPFVLSAPTGAGKTVVCALAMLRKLVRFLPGCRKIR